MKTKRKVEMFAAGRSLCEDTVARYGDCPVCPAT